jgi:hypothetical protein
LQLGTLKISPRHWDLSGSLKRQPVGYWRWGALFVSLSTGIQTMATCNHSTLELLPERKTILRCRYCHLTISGEELGDGFCPECFDASGSKRYDFEQIEAGEAAGARYRCEECGLIITSPGRP